VKKLKFLVSVARQRGNVHAVVRDQAECDLGGAMGATSTMVRMYVEVSSWSRGLNNAENGQSRFRSD
jgi:hypothetical protein